MLSGVRLLRLIGARVVSLAGCEAARVAMHLPVGAMPCILLSRAYVSGLQCLLVCLQTQQ